MSIKTRLWGKKKRVFLILYGQDGHGKKFLFNHFLNEGVGGEKTLIHDSRYYDANNNSHNEKKNCTFVH